MTTTLHIRRVLVVAGCFADAEDAIPLAVRLAALTRAEVTGILAEDPSALELPGRAIVPGRGAVEITSERMLAAFGADARAFEKRLERAAAEAALGWRFQRERGALPEVLDRLARREDVALLGYRRALRLRGPIVALGRALGAAPSGGVADGATAALADTLARAMQLPMLVLSIDPAPTDAGGRRISVPDERAALEMLDELAPTAVILDESAGAMASGPALEALLATARCPVLLRGAGRPQPEAQAT